MGEKARSKELREVSFFGGEKKGRLAAVVVITALVFIFILMVLQNNALILLVGILLFAVSPFFLYLAGTFSNDDGLRVFGQLVRAKRLFWSWFILSIIVGGITLMFMGLLYLGVYKPNIYLYPEKTMTVKVSLELPKGYLTVTDPKISGSGWEVTAHPSGELDLGGATYPYLFYEAKTLPGFDLGRAWVVKDDELGAWFDEMLPKMGLNAKETKDFTEYWNTNLPKADYYRISLLSREDLNEVVRLKVEPKPDTVIRVMLVVEGLDGPVDAVKPVIATPERNGFTVVEWGVILK
ncbi:MAG: hypothetical protein NT157_00250 [Candidatus Micrarchaeota archaeon]|nr:hypothetical protein [Candidatus Micrarchaeota archaeon]